jgi:hypothetical protein
VDENDLKKKIAGLLERLKKNEITLARGAARYAE